MLRFDRILLTGGSGVVGGYLVNVVAEAAPQAEMVCLVRSERAATRLRSFINPEFVERIGITIVDITDEKSMTAKGLDLPIVDSCLVVHCAGDVSWTKSESALRPVNVDGTRNVANLAVGSTNSQPCFVFLSTAFLAEEGACRNAYEETKRQAEGVLWEQFAASMRTAVLRCSLVVGRASDGFLPRFNGIYPLVRLIALAEVPCIIADATYQIDTVPVDYVADEVLECAKQLQSGATQILGVAAAGPEHAICVTALIGAVVDRANRERARRDLGPLPEISVVTRRQYRFLMNASDSWGLKQRFARVEEISDLMSGYLVHGESGRPIRPVAISAPAPEPSTYIGNIVDHWISRNLEKVVAERKLDWLTDEEVVA
jgi:nucleoside-diphosphate-sugar epimerase